MSFPPPPKKKQRSSCLPSLLPKKSQVKFRGTALQHSPERLKRMGTCFLEHKRTTEIKQGTLHEARFECYFTPWTLDGTHAPTSGWVVR